jgi:hypothetical protein
MTTSSSAGWAGLVTCVSKPARSVLAGAQTAFTREGEVATLHAEATWQ